MNVSKTSMRRLTENEAVFRDQNESTNESIDKLHANATEDGYVDLILDPDLELQFYCECSDENCRIRIPMTISTYKTIHEDRNCFIVVNGHDVPAVEKVIRSDTNFTIVEKYLDPPENPEQLHKTNVGNV